MQLSQISPTPLENSLGSNRTLKFSPQRGHSLGQCCHTECVPSEQEEAGNRNQVCNVTRRASTHLPLRHLLIHTKHVLEVWLAKLNVFHLQAALSKGQIPHLAICTPEGILLHIQSLPAQDHLIKTCWLVTVTFTHNSSADISNFHVTLLSLFQSSTGPHSTVCVISTQRWLSGVPKHRIARSLPAMLETHLLLQLFHVNC